jgi:fluoride ion exporter CrcB/FEX
MFLGLRGYFLANALVGLVGSAFSPAVITISQNVVSVEGIPFANVVGSLLIASLLSLLDSISPKPHTDTSLDSTAARSGLVIGAVAGFALLILRYIPSTDVISSIASTLVICLGVVAVVISVGKEGG